MSHLERIDGLITNVQIATMAGDAGRQYGEIDNGCLAWSDGKIVYAGSVAGCPEFSPKQRVDGQGGWITPGLIDCHTHLVYGGNRADEFEKLRQGQSYAAIARAGGGINRTVRGTRNASEDELFTQASRRLIALMDDGVTCVEIKSGYGLDLANELKMLRVIKRLREAFPVSIEATCLAAHTLPFDFAGNHDDYIKYIIKVILPAVKAEGLATSVDVFCESIAFSAKQTEHLFSAAIDLGFEVKGHVEQLGQNNGTDAVVKFGGLSADHVEFTTELQVKKMAEQDVTAVLLPGAFYYLSETQKPPVEAMRLHNIGMAVATDLNPGSSPLASLRLAANMGSVLFDLTPAESWAGITRHAAAALGKSNTIGRLLKGFQADFVLWDCEHPRQLIHEINTFRPKSIWHNGKERE